VYRCTDMANIVSLFEYLRRMHVGTPLVSPGYPFAQAGDGSVFMDRAEVRRTFRRAHRLLGRFALGTSPVYLDFLRGRCELPCAAWANPTRNVRGWRSPCYLIADAHYPTFAELMAQTDWDRIGPGRDPRCTDCMVHYGFEPAAALGLSPRPGDLFRMLRWQLS